MAKLIIICGPSGVGKKTIYHDIIKQPKYNCVYSVSMTTRKKRSDEQDGKDYFFVNKTQFMNAIKQGQLLEYTKYIDNFYGTPKKFIHEKIKKGLNIVLEIEINGLKQILANNFLQKENILTIFIKPTTFANLKKRLIKRHTEKLSIIKKRIQQAKWEMKAKNLFQYVITNKKVEVAQRELISIFNKELLKK